MTISRGIETILNKKGEITHITIDVKKHKEIIPLLTEKGFIEEDNFDREWKNPSNMTLEEAKRRALSYIDSLPWKK